MTSEAAADTLDGSAWILSELPDETLLDDVTVTLAFEEGRVAGTDGCNRFSGAYSLVDGVLRIGNLQSTMMACPEPVMGQAKRFTGALESVRGTDPGDETLALVDGEGTVVARLKRQDQSLAETRWTVTGYNNGKQAVVSVAKGTSLSLDFDNAGGVSGSAGCNQYRGSYSAEGKAVSIGELATTRRMCEESVMSQETAFIEALGRSTVVGIDGNRLELRNADGALQVSASRAD